MGKVTKKEVIRDMRRVGFNVTEEQVSSYFKSKNMKISDLSEFETSERGMFSDYISRKITSMNSPMYGDSTAYKIMYYHRLAKHIGKSEYSLTRNKPYKLKDVLWDEAKLKINKLKHNLKYKLKYKKLTIKENVEKVK